MSRETIYLIDTNSLITPKNSYYPFDIAPGFWKSMAEKIEEGSIAILDLVKKEILKPAKKDDFGQLDGKPSRDSGFNSVFLNPLIICSSGNSNPGMIFPPF